MDIIQDAWSPCHTICTILTSIQVIAPSYPLSGCLRDSSFFSSDSSVTCSFVMELISCSFRYVSPVVADWSLPSKSSKSRSCAALPKRHASLQQVCRTVVIVCFDWMWCSHWRVGFFWMDCQEGLHVSRRRVRQCVRKSIESSSWYAPRSDACWQMSRASPFSIWRNPFTCWLHHLVIWISGGCLCNIVYVMRYRSAFRGEWSSLVSLLLVNKSQTPSCSKITVQYASPPPSLVSSNSLTIWLELVTSRRSVHGL